MLVVAAYDITEDSRRARTAAVLQSMGERIQKSVFLLNVDADSLAEATARLRDILDLDEDSLYVFRQCITCWDHVACHGQAHPPAQELFWAVL
ncbi:MAG: CRISPR-associated endonuclease Cas2 [Micrococcales bacterium]|nr:MAG: CRISPR-associated endonuclease Cas2 [Micrococcales bacterium]PIE27060.1 MAG: CRISPR-associated endonuclease Cas2 [Micrococcales bacterium]